jgi:hypothetical protein
VPAEATHRVIFLGPYSGQIEHWSSNRTFACPGGEVCRTSHAKYRVDWYAYAPVAYLDLRTNAYAPWVLQITSNLEFRLKGRELRGQVWDLARVPNRGKSAELLGELVEIKPQDSVPPEFSIRPPLERLFGKGRLYLGSCNPTPPPLILEEFAVENPAVAKEKEPEKGSTLKEQIGQLGTSGNGRPNVRYY